MPTITVRFYALRLVQDMATQLLANAVWFEITPIQTFYGAAYELGVRQESLPTVAAVFYQVTGRTLPPPIVPEPRHAPDTRWLRPFAAPGPLPAARDTRVLDPYPSYRTYGPRHC